MVLLFEDYPSAHALYEKVGENNRETSQAYIRMLVAQ